MVQTIKLGGGLEAIPNTGTGSYQICLYNAQSECITAQGAGNQMVLGSPGANFNIDENGAEYQFDTNGGNLCLREKNNHAVVGSSGGCSWSDQAEIWVQEDTAGYYIFGNGAHGSDVLCPFGTTGNLGGKPVWADPAGGSNQWSKWKF